MTTEELIEAAYFEGWKDGAATGESDSPDWNAGEDWAESGARKRIKQNTRHEPTDAEDDLCLYCHDGLRTCGCNYNSEACGKECAGWTPVPF